MARCCNCSSVVPPNIQGMFETDKLSTRYDKFAGHFYEGWIEIFADPKITHEGDEAPFIYFCKACSAKLFGYWLLDDINRRLERAVRK